VAEYLSKRNQFDPTHILTAADCNTLNTSSRGFYWIEGGGLCTLGDVGSADNPGTPALDPNLVVLVLDETALQINANNEIHGYVFTLDHPGDSGGQDIQLNGGAKIFGAFLSNYDMGTHLNGTLGIVWTDYGDLLLNPNDSDFGVLSVVPGSWNDL